ASDHKWTLIALYLVTLIMRASFYLTIAVIQSNSYMGGILEDWQAAAVLIVYPIAELSTVSIFGSYSDKIGRKPILVVSLFMTAITAFLFAINFIAVLVIFFGILFGIAIAAKVTTTLSIIADTSSEDNRARLMGYYDLSTLMGLAGGYGMGILLLQFGFEATPLLLAAAIACAICGIAAYLIIKETRHISTEEVSVMRLLKQVASDKRIQKMLPVYVPIISLYGLLIANVESIIEEHFSFSDMELIVLFAILGGSLVLGIVVNGHLSDHFKKRRPFIVIGLISFGILAYLLVSNAENFTALWAIWPIIPIFGFTAGAFPPAAMAYLTDVSEKESRGSTMGVYSIFFGSGMIIGPAAGLFAYGNYGLFGLTVLILVIIVIACIGTYFMPEVTFTDEDEVSISNA
ncbi:MAG: MFS transporter, partial [Candidatus Thorarchaeota archaeon]|nr:MFS transporter [Candidatus Thorarchaeota archaeon]